MAYFVITLYSEFDNRSGIGVFDTEQGLQYLQLEDLSKSYGDSQLRGVCQVGDRLYVTTQCSLRLYQIADSLEAGQPLFQFLREVVRPEWLLNRRPNADLLALHYCSRRQRLMVACNALASIDEFDLEGGFLKRRHLWEIAPRHFYLPKKVGGRRAYGHVRGISETNDGEVFLTVAFRNWSETGSLISYDSGELLVDGLTTPHSGLHIGEHYFTLDVQHGALVALLDRGCGEPMLHRARPQSFAARHLKVNLRGLAHADGKLYAGFFNFETEEKLKLASQIVRFDLSRGEQEHLYPLPEVTGFSYPAPFFLTPLKLNIELGERFILFDPQSANLHEQPGKSGSPDSNIQPSVKRVAPAPMPIGKRPEATSVSIGKPMIELQDISLAYRKGIRLQDWFNNKRVSDFKALDDVSFTLHEGEVLGLVGRNGAGKSTMGMLLAGILQPDKGNIIRRGRIQLLSLGIGFNNELSGRDNVFVNAALLGMSRWQVKEHLNEIIEFSEIGEFIDEPIRTYSAGMRSRLAFAIATVIQPDVLILDEVLSTGDDAFRHKAEARMRDMKGKAKCVVMVSHSAGQIKKLCTRVIWLERGHLLLDGKPRQVMPEYEAFCQNPKKWLRRHPNIAARLSE